VRPRAAQIVTAEAATTRTTRSHTSDHRTWSRSALGANASPEVTHRFCRLPLVTLLHWPEAIHLGVRMRFSVRPAHEGRSSGAHTTNQKRTARKGTRTKNADVNRHQVRAPQPPRAPCARCVTHPMGWSQVGLS